MSTPEQAALLAKHGMIYASGASRCALCYVLGSLAYFPCDVHKMAQLKDVEIAELQRALLFLTGDTLDDAEGSTLTEKAMVVCIKGQTEEIKGLQDKRDAEIAEAVSEAVERIVEAIGAEAKKHGAGDVCSIDCEFTDGESDVCNPDDYLTLIAFGRSIALLRSRDWSAVRE